MGELITEIVVGMAASNGSRNQGYRLGRSAIVFVMMLVYFESEFHPGR
jgi:hypothetical protein